MGKYANSIASGNLNFKSFPSLGTDSSASYSMSSSQIQQMHTTALSSSLKNYEGMLIKTASGQWYCGFCSRRFHTKQGCLRHLLQQHLKRHRFVCEICAKGFMIRGAYIGHMNKHDQTRAYRCPNCSKSYFYKNALKRHLNEKKCESMSHSE